jgi:hypothetical protein
MNIVNSWSKERRHTALQKFVSYYKNNVEPHEQDILMMYRPVDDDIALLMNYGIHSAMYRVDSHRSSIREVFELVTLANPDTACLAQRVENHDMSTYDVSEIFGYTDRCIQGRNTTLWQDALKHHRAVNDHHPEFHTMAEVDMDTGSYLLVDHDMGEECFMESLLEMLSNHYRLLKTNVINLDKLFQPQEWFLLNYNSNRERNSARKYCHIWCENIKSLINTTQMLNWETKYKKKLFCNYNLK